MIDWAAMSIWEQAFVFFAVLAVADFLFGVPSALRGIHREMKRRNDREDGRR